MPETLSATQITTVLFQLFLLFGGIIAFAWKLYQGKADEQFAVPDWPIHWPIFAFLAWTASAIYVFSPAIVVSLLSKHLSPAELTAFATCASSIPVILFFRIMSGSNNLSQFSFGEINGTYVPWSRVLRISSYSLLWLFPMLIGFAKLWDGAYFLWEELGYPIERAQQQAVEFVERADSPLALAVLLFAIVVLVPISEELLFRGLLYRYIKKHMKPITAMALSGFCFSILHGSIGAFLPLLFLGMILAYVYEITGSLRVPIMLHALFNLTNLLFIFNTPEIIPHA